MKIFDMLGIDPELILGQVQELMAAFNRLEQKVDKILLILGEPDKMESDMDTEDKGHE